MLCGDLGPMLGSPGMRIRGSVRVHTSAKGEAPAEREEPCDEDEFDSFGAGWLGWSDDHCRPATRAPGSAISRPKQISSSGVQGAMSPRVGESIPPPI